MGELQIDELGPRDAFVRNRNAVFYLGIIEILLGVALIALETGALIMFNDPATPGYPVQYAGIWTGVFAVLAGVIQLLAGRKTTTPRLRGRLFAVGLGTAIVSVLQALVMFGLTTYNIYVVRNKIKTDTSTAQKSDGIRSTLEDVAMIRSVAALIYITLVILTLVSTILDCCNACGKGRHAAAAHTPDQVVYTSVDGNQVKQIKIYNKSQQVKA